MVVTVCCVVVGRSTGGRVESTQSYRVGCINKRAHSMGSL